MTSEEEQEMYEAAVMNAGNFGPAMDMFHPDYGWILCDGKLTKAGERFFDDTHEQLKKWTNS